ncbi:biliverdin-producing heme oxygenase [Haloechinothrix sp. YIM 98757]|uniref:heme oxygenase (biliverdin-producing) n=1 Tax=Haloechinothrix aidingensis TaxID=2752311 RepID=A0A838AEY7_9PSEU|nr:biliverdin-producing heme oxygenase [Haloechinothrix aidingensis]MBA0127688.1 biliverdin-producing heme oxygenase [Haloechinothrix aidingensis]
MAHAPQHPTDLVSLSQALRSATSEAHDRAHRSRYMTELLAGSLSIESYAQLAGQYYFVYHTLEEATRAMRHHPLGGRFALDELTRLPALSADLAYLLGPGWRTAIDPLPATRRYCKRMRAVAFDSPAGLVAHHYTRYLGDLAGGQVVRRLLRDTYGITDDGALFYRFDRITNPHAFRTTYRALLDSSPWTDRERRSIVEESLLAYELNIAVLGELADDIPELQAA